MSDQPPKPQSPWQLNSGRVVLLVLGGLLVLITISALLGGLGDYQQLREASQAAKAAAEAAPTTTP
jgi:hypothetical protein